jgi:hypothetical protein
MFTGRQVARGFLRRDGPRACATRNLPVQGRTPWRLQASAGPASTIRPALGSVWSRPDGESGAPAGRISTPRADRPKLTRAGPRRALCMVRHLAWDGTPSPTPTVASLRQTARRGAACAPNRCRRPANRPGNTCRSPSRCDEGSWVKWETSWTPPGSIGACG